MRKFLFLFIIAVTTTGISESRAEQAVNCSDRNFVRDLLQNGNQSITNELTKFNTWGFSREFFNQVRTCEKVLTPDQKKCLQNMKNFLVSTDKYLRPDIQGAGIGLNVPDSVSTKIAQAQYPEQMDVPDFLLQLPKNWKQIVENCKKDSKSHPDCQEILSWDIIEYQSIDCFQNDGSSVLVRIQNARFDRYVLLRQSISQDFRHQQLLTIQKKDKNGKDLEFPVPYFGFFPDGKRAENVSSFPNCITCHQAGPNVVRILPGTLSFGSKDTLDRINEGIAKTGVVDFPNMLPMSHRGPSYGEKNQTCTKCHGNSAGDIRSFQRLGSERLFQAVSLEMSMPPRPMDHPSQKYFAALEKTWNLPIEKQLEIKNLYPNQRGRCEPETLASARLKHLLALRKLNVLSQPEYLDAKNAFNALFAENQRLYRDLVIDHRLRFSDWIQGGSPACTKSSN